MCLGFPCDKCIAEHSSGITCRRPTQPNIPELYQTLPNGSLWRRRRDGRQATIVHVGWGRPTSLGGRVHYRTDTGGGYCGITRWRETYEPAPITAKECGIESVKLDFADVEQRVIAALEGVNTELPCGLAGTDLHKLRAAEIFDVKPSEVTPAMRRVGKAANFITAYTHKEKRNG